MSKCLVCGSALARTYQTPGTRVTLCDSHRPAILPAGWRVVDTTAAKQSDYGINSPWERQKP